MTRRWIKNLSFFNLFRVRGSLKEEREQSRVKTARSWSERETGRERFLKEIMILNKTRVLFVSERNPENSGRAKTKTVSFIGLIGIINRKRIIETMRRSNARHISKELSKVARSLTGSLASSSSYSSNEMKSGFHGRWNGFVSFSKRFELNEDRDGRGLSEEIIEESLVSM